MVTERAKGAARITVGKLNFGKLMRRRKNDGTSRFGVNATAGVELGYRQCGPRSGQSLSAFDSENNSRALRIELSGAR